MMNERIRERLLSPNISRGISGNEGIGGMGGRGFGDKWRSEKQWVNCDLRTFDYSVLGQ